MYNLKAGEFHIFIIVLLILFISGCQDMLVNPDSNVNLHRSITSYSTANQVYDVGGDHYVYAPSVILDGNTEHIFACQNTNSGSIVDSIYYYKRVNGTIASSIEILSSGPAGAWDSHHVCDPVVVDGSFTLFGNQYSYALFYTGNNINESKNNQVGVAFSNSFSGPWVRYPYPLIYTPFGTNEWGVGQPSVTKVNSAGELLVFYTQGMDSITPANVHGWRAHLDISDMSNIITYSYTQITDNGLTSSSGGIDYLNNFDMMYDPSRDRFFCIKEQHPYPTTFPEWIGSDLEIVSLPGSDIWQGTGTWATEGEITTTNTGLDRNHNGGFKRSAAGTLLNPSRLDIMFTESDSVDSTPLLSWPAVLWTYDLWDIWCSIN